MPLLLGVRGYGRQFSKAREWYRISRKCSYGFRFPLGRFRLMFCSVLLLSTAPALAELPSSLEIPFRCEDALLVPPERMQRMFVEAEQGDVESRCILGVSYYVGKFGKPNY